jgi:hypothetical protein
MGLNKTSQKEFEFATNNCGNVSWPEIRPQAGRRVKQRHYVGGYVRALKLYAVGTLAPAFDSLTDTTMAGAPPSFGFPTRLFAFPFLLNAQVVA